MKRRIKTILFLVALVSAVLLWSYWPTPAERILATAFLVEKKGEEGGQRFRDRLIACGPSAIQPCIEAASEHSIWTRPYAYLPQVLAHFGEQGRDSLLAEIDQESDPRRRLYLIGALQNGFSDFSRLDLVIRDATNNPSQWSLRHLGNQVAYCFSNAPTFVQDDRVSTEFIAWWSTNSPPRQ